MEKNYIISFPLEWVGFEPFLNIIETCLGYKFVIYSMMKQVWHMAALVCPLYICSNKYDTSLYLFLNIKVNSVTC